MKTVDSFVKCPTRFLRPLAAVFAALAFAALGTPVQQAHAQDEVTGTVTDAISGNTLPGASVRVVGTEIGTATGVEGQYSIDVPAGADSLLFSFVGYEPETVAIAGRSVVDVALEPASAELQEVVVIGYGEQEESDVTGTIARVTAEELNESANVSPEQLISGKVAGVQVSPSSGAPGTGSFIRIRGATSVNADNQPLIVIDGVPLSNNGNTSSRNPLNFLNPKDVESVTVLKDASSTAIYGSRGANGVIIIETRNASEGDARISYSGSISASRVQDEIDVLDADRFRQVITERTPQMSGMLGATSTDWQDLVQRDAFGQEHSLSLARGFEDASFRLSLGYLGEDGVLQASRFERLSLSLNYNQDLFDDRLEVISSLKGSRTQNQFEPGGLVGSAASFDPTQPVRNVASPFGGFFEWDAELPENNPVASYILESNTGEGYRSIGNVEARYDLPFIEGLSARANAGYDVSMGEREFFAPTFLKAQAEADFPGSVTRANYRQFNTLFDAYLNYDRYFDGIESDFDVTAGYSWQDFNEEYPEYTVNGLSTNIYGTDRVDVLQADSLSQVTPTLAEIPSRLISLFGRLNYTFKDRYLLTATVRRDGSSKFGPANRWGTFPSAALAWRIDEEPFMENLDDAISTLKLRVSAGITGNQEIGDFLYAPFYLTGDARSQALFGNEFVPTIRPSAADETLQWEETTSYNLGLDYGFLEDRVSGNLNVYVKDTNELLFPEVVAGGANLSNRVLTNIGSMRNQGIEFSIDADAIRPENFGDAGFSWNAQFNAAYNDNELLSIDSPDADTTGGFDQIPTGGIAGGTGNTVQVLREGEPVNSFYTYRHVRDENGDPLYEDTNDDGVINEADLYEDTNGDGLVNADDRVITGNPQADWTLGHTSRFGYAGFDLSFTLRANLGQQVYNNVASNYGHFSRLTTNQVPSNIHASALETGFDAPQYLSDVYVEDASFLRVDHVTLGYSTRLVPGVNRARLYGRIGNALLITGYSGVDPEVYAAGIGIDNNVYPRSRTFTLGIDLDL